jgi:hypothetical protein
MEAGSANGVGRGPDERTIERLLDWRPGLGVISAYIAVDPGDRSEGWRIAARESLERILETEPDTHRRRRALEATIERIQAHLPREGPPSSGRCQIAFCEVTEGEGRDMWMGVQMRREETEVVYRDRPYLTPLLELLDEGAPVGIVAVSSERVRLYEWGLGHLGDVHDWEAVMFTPEWRERKGPSSPDPARLQGTSSSGRDQYEQRLEANRERFLEQVGGLIAKETGERQWRHLLAFGNPHQVDQVREGAKGTELLLADEVNVISENDRGRLIQRIENAVDEVNRRRELDLVQAAVDAALARAGRGAVGLADTERSLAEGRVRHLLVDAEAAGNDVAEMEEALVEQALRTSADVTPVEGQAAEVLREHGGVAALLRY